MRTLCNLCGKEVEVQLPEEQEKGDFYCSHCNETRFSNEVKEGDNIMRKIMPIKFSQTMRGEHFIEQENNKIEINTNKMDLEEIRELMNGVANIFQSLSSALWRYELKPKDDLI